jgi:chromosome segregation ATPase
VTDDAGLAITEGDLSDDDGLSITEGDLSEYDRPHISRWLWVLAVVVFLGVLVASIGLVVQKREPPGLDTNVTALNVEAVALTEEVDTLNTTLAAVNGSAANAAASVALIRPQLQDLPAKLAAVSAGLTQVEIRARTVDTSDLTVVGGKLDLLRAALNIELAKVARIVAGKAADLTKAVAALRAEVDTLTKKAKATKKSSTTSNTKLAKQIKAAHQQIHALHVAAKNNRTAVAHQLATLRHQVDVLTQTLANTPSG